MPAVADRLPPGLLPDVGRLRAHLDRLEEEADVVRKLLRATLQAQTTPEQRQRLAEATRGGARRGA